MTILLKNRSTDAIALIIVMVVLTVLGIMAGGFAYSMKIELKLAQQSNLDSDFEWLGRSGVELARLVLSEQMKGSGNQAGSTVDSYKQKWAGGPGDGVNTNEGSNIQLENVQLVEGGGSFSVKIVDAERKFNINKSSPTVNMQQVLQQAMLAMGVDAGASPTIVDSILDWMDRDQDEHLAGAETPYYSRLDPPYVAKDGPIDDMVELLLIKGIDIDPAILWGGNSTNTPRWASSFGVTDASRFGREEPPPAYRMGLMDLFTPISGGWVNINTASAEVLQMIPVIADPNIAQAIIQARAGQDGQDGTSDDVPFQTVGEVSNRNIPGLPQNIQNQLAQYCRTMSRVFEVRVDCEIGGLHREYIALVDRMGPSVKVLWMYWKGGAANVGPTVAQQ